MAAPDWLAQAKALIAQGKAGQLQLDHTKALFKKNLNVGLLKQASAIIAHGGLVSGKAAHELKKAGIVAPPPKVPLTSTKFQPSQPQPLPAPPPGPILVTPVLDDATQVSTFPVPGTAGFDLSGTIEKFGAFAEQAIQSKLGSLLGPAEEKLNGQAASAGMAPTPTPGVGGDFELEPVESSMPRWLIPAAIAGGVVLFLVARR